MARGIFAGIRIEWPSRWFSCCKPFQAEFAYSSAWRDLDWHCTSRCFPAITELLVLFSDVCTKILSQVRYDTIRGAILTCARKPTWVSLIDRTETTTKNCKTEKKLKSKNGYARSNSKSLRNHIVSPEEEKERLQWELLQKKEVLSCLEWKIEWVMEK